MEEIERAKGGDILFYLPPEWANIPFELCYIPNKGFLGRIFQIGTMICLQTEGTVRKELPSYEKMLIIADPAGNLPSAHHEGVYLKQFARKNGLEIHLIASGQRQKISEAIEKSSMVHFAGHSFDTDSPHTTGWEIGSDTILNLSEIEKMRKSLSVPWLIFSNSCHAGNCGEGPYLSGIAGAFLKAGVSQVIAPIKWVNDREALEFARSFYKYLFKRVTPAESLRAAKQERQKSNPDSVTPLFYRLYGDPRFDPKAGNLLDEGKQKDKKSVLLKPAAWTLSGIVIALLLIFIVEIRSLTILTSLAENEFSVFKEVISQFEKEHYVILRVKNKKCDEILRMLRRKEKIDIIVMDINKRGSMRMEEELQDLSNERKTLIHSTVHQILIKHLSEKECRYFIPFRPNVRLLFVNKLRFKDFYGDSALLPANWTWQDVLKFAKEIKDQKGEARVIIHGAGADAPMLLLELLRAAGGDPGNLFDDSSRQAIGFLRLLWPYVTAVNWQTATGALLAESAYMGRNWCFIIRGLEKAGQLDCFEVYTGPRWKENSKPHNLLGGDYLAIPKSARHPAQAVKFIHFLVSSEVQKKLAKELWWPPIRTEILRELELDDKYGPYFRQMKKALLYADPVPAWWNPDISKIYSELFNRITDSNENLDSLVVTFQERIDLLK